VGAQVRHPAPRDVDPKLADLVFLEIAVDEAPEGDCVDGESQNFGCGR
jgi:hypothetical protein